MCFINSTYHWVTRVLRSSFPYPRSSEAFFDDYHVSIALSPFDAAGHAHLLRINLRESFRLSSLRFWTWMYAWAMLIGLSEEKVPRTRCHLTCQLYSAVDSYCCDRDWWKSASASHYVAQILPHSAYQCTGKFYHASTSEAVDSDVSKGPRTGSWSQRLVVYANAESAHRSTKSRNYRVSCNSTKSGSKEPDS